ncbi:hypothetical protein SPBRAN_1300 [uncultured Candidatus Thioglobus sp.]|nr:hypothetical protein SPBRAN_1300 [uncultured Candidatus Thioglobus sp.]
MCRAIFAFFWGTVTLLLSGNHVKDQAPILDLISLDEVLYYQDNG